MTAQFLALLAAGLASSYTLDVWADHETPMLEPTHGLLAQAQFRSRR